MCQTQPLEAFYGRLVPKVKGTRKFSPIQVSQSVQKDESLSTKSLMAGLQCHVRWEDLSNLELTREIQTHWLQMKSGRYLSLWAIHLIMLNVFLHSYSYGSPLPESLPSWTSTRARSPGRGFWTPTTGRFDLYIVRKHKWHAWQQYCPSADTWERSLWDRARQRRVSPGLADFQMYHFMNFIFVSDLTNVLLQGDSVWHHCGQVK